MYVSNADASESQTVCVIKGVSLIMELLATAKVMRRVVPGNPDPFPTKTCLIKPTGVLCGLQAAPLVRKNNNPMVLIRESQFKWEIGGL